MTITLHTHCAGKRFGYFKDIRSWGFDFGRFCLVFKR